MAVVPVRVLSKAHRAWFLELGGNNLQIEGALTNADSRGSRAATNLV